MITQKLYLIVSFLTITQLSFGQTAPVASSVIVLGAAYFNTSLGVGTTLTGSYVFSDPVDLDKEGTSTYNWYRSNAGNGTGLSASLATTKTYTVVTGDQGKYLYFKVTPIDDEPRSGTPVLSTGHSVTSVTSATIPNYTIASGTTYSPASGTSNWNVDCASGASTGLTVSTGTYTIYGDLDLTNNNSGFTITVSTGATLILYGKLIAKNNVTVNVDGTFNMFEGLDAKNGGALVINGDVSIVGDVAFDNGTTITVNSDGGLTVDGNFDIKAGTITVTDPGTIVIDGNLTGSATVNGDGTIYVGGSSSIPDGQVVLPIVLTYFHAYNNENNITLSWQTASEENNDYFTIERAPDGINYEPIATVHGAGNSSNVLNYSYTDNAPLTGTSYYRLKQTDYNGKFEIFEAVSVTYLNEEIIHYGPVPTTDALNVTINGSMGKASLKIINMLGAVVRDMSQLENQTSIDVSTLPKGIYILSIEGDKSRFVKQIMIK